MQNGALDLVEEMYSIRRCNVSREATEWLVIGTARIRKWITDEE